MYFILKPDLGGAEAVVPAFVEPETAFFSLTVSLSVGASALFPRSARVRRAAIGSAWALIRVIDAGEEAWPALAFRFSADRRLLCGCDLSAGWCLLKDLGGRGRPTGGRVLLSCHQNRAIGAVRAFVRSGFTGLSPLYV